MPGGNPIDWRTLTGVGGVRSHNWIAVATACIAVLGPGATLAQQPASPAEELVRAVYFEGLPLAAAARLDDADGLRLAELLADPSESSHHANIAMALGACACGPAFEALAAADLRDRRDRDTRGMDRETRLAQRAIAAALGRLGRSEPRAVDGLGARARAPLPERSDREARHRRTAVLQGLALSGSPRAGGVLAEVEARASARGDSDFARRAAIARERARPRP